MQEVQFPEIGLQQKHKGKSQQQQQHVFGRELQVSPSPAEPSSRASRREVAGGLVAGRASPEVHDGPRSPKSWQRNSAFAFRIPMPMTTCSVEER